MQTMTEKKAGPVPRLRARLVFFDIDDTVTGGTGVASGRSILDDLVRLVAESSRLDLKMARKKIDSIFDVENDAVSGHYTALGITEPQLWAALMEWMPGEVSGHPDAVIAIRRLHEAGMRLWTATTNSGLICRVKLAAAGLGDERGCPCFERLLGGSEVHPKGKSTPDFYRSLLQMAGVKPEEVVHVGDNPQADLELARAAGITQVVLPRRSQAASWVREPDGGIYVRSLELLPEMVERMP